MTSFKDKLNAHLPIVLQFLSTASLIVLAITALCGSRSLKKLSEAHEMPAPVALESFHEGHNH